MSPHEKAVQAINARLERLQANLRGARDADDQRFLFQSIVMLVGVSDALNDYATRVAAHVRRRQGEMNQAGEALAARQAEGLQAAQALLEKFKANPGDRDLRQELQRTQRDMETAVKELRREVHDVQRELAVPVAMIDEAALTIRRLAEAEQLDGVKRQLRAIIGQVAELYAANRALPKGLVPASDWGAAAWTSVDEGASFVDSYARALQQAILALEWMALTVSGQPPTSTADAATRTTEAAAARIKATTSRLAEERS